MTCVCVCCLVAAAPGALQPEPDRPDRPHDDGAETGDALERLYLSSRGGIELAPVVDQLALRMPNVDLRVEWSLDERDGLSGEQAFVNVEPSPVAGVRIEVITGDGRAYLRDVDVALDDPRLLSTDMVSLLTAIRSDTVEATKTDVALPTSSEQAVVEAAVEEVVAPLRGVEPEAVEPEAVEPGPIEPPPDPIVRTVEVPPAPFEGTEIVVRLAPALLVQPPAPDFAEPLAGAGGVFGVGARWRTGLGVMGELQYLTLADGETRLHRVNLHVGVGYAWRRGAFELPVRAGPTLHLYRLIDQRAAVDLGGLGSSAVGLGGAVSVAPGWLVHPLRTGPVSAVRVGGSLALQGSATFDEGGAGSVAGYLDGDTPLYRAGGLDLLLGFDVAVYFGLGRATGSGSTGSGSRP